MRIARLCTAAFLATAMAACVQPVPVGGVSPIEYDPEPLVARLSPIGGLSFWVNRPAHVAIFEIAPGAGTSLLFPASSYEAGLIDGIYRPLNSGVRGLGRWYYASDPLGTTRYQPRILFMIASTEPLNISPVHQAPGMVREMLGFQQFASMNAYQTMDRLIQSVVPPQYEEDWATDIYVIWPEAPLPHIRQANVTYIRCSNGRIVAVPVWYGSLRCPGDNASVRPPDTPAPGDSSSRPDKPVVKPPKIFTADEPGKSRRTPTSADRIDDIERHDDERRARKRALIRPERLRDRSEVSRPPEAPERRDAPRRAERDDAERRSRDRPAERTREPVRAEPPARQSRPEPRQEPTRSEPVRADPPREPAARSAPSEPSRREPLH